MDVSALAPFSKVACPACGEQTRVKFAFGPYTLTRRHAIGGMSVVFIAHDRTLDREVVVKILNEEYGGDEKRIGAFEEEARLTASFSHPHVVRVFTTGRAFGRFYIAMELVGGGHFEHHIGERGSIPEKEALPLAIQVAEGLKAAQAAGLIHRDVKPGNILLDASGNAKIVDFGLALVTKGGTAQATEIWATPYYVPPETIEGLPEDFRSDMYAFGATFYHALAGKPPCGEESMDTNKLREAKRRIPPLARIAPRISAETCAVIDRAMAHDPAQRFRSYDDLLAALRSAQRGRRAKPAAAAANPSRRGAARGTDRRTLMAVAAVVVAAVAFLGWRLSRPEAAAAGTGGTTGTGGGLAQPGAGGEAGGGRVEGARVASSYREAGEALRAGNYEKARTLFAAVRDDPAVLQPTGSWAACETVICDYLDGRAQDARADALKAKSHLAGAGLAEAVRAELAGALERTEDLQGIRRDEGAAAPTGAGVLAALLAGLKNWEHGMAALAVPHFEAVAKVEPRGADAWVEPYRAIAAGYLADFARLQAAEPKVWPDTPADCRALVDELHALHAGLKTKGRARFNVRVWQLELEKRARALEAGGSGTKGEPAGDPLAGSRKKAAACQFDEAVADLKGLEDSEKRDALLMLCEDAAAFVTYLEGRLSQPAGALKLTLRDGTQFASIAGSRRGGLRVLEAGAKARDVDWAEIAPDSVIEIYRALVKSETAEGERQRRHEQAVAYDLLAGDPARAREAAAVLVNYYPDFKSRWVLMQRGVE